MKGIFYGALLMLILFSIVAQISISYGDTSNPIVEVVSVETGKLTFTTWNPSFYFYKNEWLSAKITVTNNDNANRTATIYLNGIDELSQPISTYTVNVDLLPNETQVIFAPLYLPTWAFTGNAHVTAFAKTLPDNTYSLQVTSYFYLSRATASYLELQTSSKTDMNTSASVDGYNGMAPATVQLDPGSHAVQVQTIVYGWYSDVYYKYTFQHWENGLKSTSRTIDISTSTNETITAYYTQQRSNPQPLVSHFSPD